MPYKDLEVKRLSGLSSVNIELSSVCDKAVLCPFCGHQDDKINPQKKGQMPLTMLMRISEQIPPGVVVQFHRDGEPTAYTCLDKALDAFSHCITSIVTHGETLAKKADQIIGKCDAVTVSAFNGDQDVEIQFASVKEFLRLKGDRRPGVNIKIVGTMQPEREALYGSLGVPIIRRGLHVPSGDTRYAKRNPTIPEHGICLDFLHKPTVDWRGRLFICVRLDPTDKGLLGDLNESSLDELWNSPLRQEWLKAHVAGRRDLASPLCHSCIYYGVPVGD